MQGRQEQGRTSVQDCGVRYNIRKGISKESEIIEIGSKLGILEKSGSWFSYNGSRLGQGKEAVRALLASDAPLSGEIEAKIRARLSEAAASSSGDDDEAPEDDLD